MVVIVDLDEEVPADMSNVKPLHHFLADPEEIELQAAEGTARPNPNVDNGFSAALGCYPIARQLANQLDLITLDSLSRTCRQFRANLLEYRNQLIKHTLHCEFEDAFSVNSPSWRLTSGKVGRCALDMVGECQRCGTVVCRNCTIKPPPTPALRARHRRLCRVCSKAPLSLLTAPLRERSLSSGTLSPSAAHEVSLNGFQDLGTRAFTASAFERTPCCCETMVWLCQTCGQHLKKVDTMYVRAWSWRTRYSHYLGGVGTGAGEGNEGVECGRGSHCLAAKLVEQEVECDAETLASIEGASPDRWTGTSYHAQEIEGVGGGFKMKAKKHMRVGECVKIYEDEKDRSIQFLEREVSGSLRSWCSWCERVVPGTKDFDTRGERGLSSADSSSSSARSVA